MATYPAYAQWLDSTETISDGIETERATNGALRGRSFYTAKKRDFTIVHGFLSSTNKATLEAFYETHRTGTAFDFTWAADSVSRSCIFRGIRFAPRDGGWWEAIASLSEV